MHDANTNLQRGIRLYETSRYEQAEQEFRMALTADPDHAQAHAMLALCLVEQQKYKPATQEAEQAVHLEPDSSFTHYALARVHEECNRLPEAAAAMEESLRLDPYDPSSYGVLAAIRFRQERWRDALAATDEGLKIDPQHATCTNLRAAALVKLGRKDEATGTIAQALARDPENAYSHANQGWAYLDKGQPKEALPHFSEALRINPELPLARAGMVEALKARYFFYRWMLAYFLWMAKLSGQARWGILIGGYIAYRIASNVANDNPELKPWLMPLIVAYVVFAVMTWVASPLMNLTLRFNRFGRHLLSRGEVMTSNFVGLCVAGAVAGLIARYGFDVEWGLWAALVSGLCIPPISAVHYCDEGWPRTTMLLITLAVVVMGAVSLLGDIVGPPSDDADSLGIALLQLVAGVCTLGFIVGAIGSQFAANYLSTATVRH